MKVGKIPHANSFSGWSVGFSVKVNWVKDGMVLGENGIGFRQVLG